MTPVDIFTTMVIWMILESPGVMHGIQQTLHQQQVRSR